MKTSLKAISLFLSAGFPATMVAEFLSARRPSPVDSGHAFNAFVIALTLLIVVTDYSQPVRPLALDKPTRLPTARTSRPSHDRDNLRLAA